MHDWWNRNPAGWCHETRHRHSGSNRARSALSLARVGASRSCAGMNSELDPVLELKQRSKCAFVPAVCCECEKSQTTRSCNVILRAFCCFCFFLVFLFCFFGVLVSSLNACTCSATSGALRRPHQRNLATHPDSSCKCA